MVDTFVGHWTPKGTAAVQFQSDASVHFVTWEPSQCTEEELYEGECIPFAGSSGVLLTVGYMVIVVMFLPLALMDLKVCLSAFGAWSADQCLLLVSYTLSYLSLYLHHS